MATAFRDVAYRPARSHTGGIDVATAGLAIVVTLLTPAAAAAQVNKGVLGFDGDSDAGYVRLRGNSDTTIVFTGPVGSGGNDRNRGLLQLRDANGGSNQTRATLFVPSGRGQLQLDDPGNNLRVRLSSSLRDKGPKSNESYGYLDLLSGSGAGGSIAWLGATDSGPRRGRLILYDATGSSAQSRASLFVPSGRGQLQLDDPGNNLRVRLSSSLRDKGPKSNESYGYLDLLSGSGAGGSIAWLGATDSDSRRGRLILYDATGSSAQSRATLIVPSGRGQLLLDDPADSRRVRLSSSLRDKGPQSNQSYGYLEFTSGSAAGTPIVWLGGTDSAPDRGRLDLRDASATQSLATLTTTTDGDTRCGVLTLRSTNGDSLSFNACHGEKSAVIRYPGSADQEIHYNALEGPEIGLYTRGRARLKGGVAEIELPRHFALVVSKQDLTAQLTPFDATSRGLAITELSPGVLKVVELGGPRPAANYEFAFLVQGVRAGTEQYAAVRKRAPREPDAPTSERDTPDEREPASEKERESTTIEEPIEEATPLPADTDRDPEEREDRRQ